jgi:hypothetical protein
LGNIASHVDLTSGAKATSSKYEVVDRDNGLGAMKRQLWQSLIAVLAGNAIYFSVERFLPARAQHHLYQIDWGLAVDFWICLVCYGLVLLIR